MTPSTRKTFPSPSWTPLKATLGAVFATFFLVPAANAADRVLDFSSGCKLYRLENRAWVATDAASFEGIGLLNQQIVKDERFTVFRTEAGVFGVNQKCVMMADGSPSVVAPAPIPQPRPRVAQPRRTRPAQQTARPATRRKSAAKPSLFDNRNPWSIAFGAGMNISPKGKQSSSLVPGEIDAAYTSTISFLGQVDYRVAPTFRVAAELGVSQLQRNDPVSGKAGNSTSHFSFRPEYVMRANPSLEVYGGPILGLFFLAQGAQEDTNSGLSTKKQTPMSVLIGAQVGSDYALNEQFDVGMFLRYMKPGALTIKGEPNFEATLTASYMTFGARFVVHF
jgi:hypothetical protein